MTEAEMKFWRDAYLAAINGLCGSGHTAISDIPRRAKDVADAATKIYREIARQGM